MMKSQLILLFSLCLCSMHTSAQESLSLLEARSLALEQNTQSRIAEIEVDKARAVVKETLAIGLPQVNASGSFNHFLDIPVQVFPDFISPAVYGVLIEEELLPSSAFPEPNNVAAQFGTEFNASGGVTLSQLLFNGSYLVGLQAARSYVDLSLLQKEGSTLEVLSAVDRAYYNVLMAEENIDVLRASKINLEKSLADTKALYAEGFVEEQDTEQLAITVNTVSSELSNAERQLLLAKQLLNLQLGRALDAPLNLSDNAESILESPEMPTEDPLVISQLLVRHPDMRIMDQNLLLQELRIREQRSRYLPTLNGFFSHTQQAFRNDFDFFDGGGDWFPNTLWGLQLDVPIFSSGMKHQQVKQLEMDLDELELYRSDTEKGLALELENARIGFINAMENYEVSLENVALAERIRDKTQIKYQEGISSSFELDQIENQYLQAEGQRIMSTLALLNAITEYKKASNTFSTQL